MYNSVDSLNNSEEECELVRSRLKPVRLHLPSRAKRHPDLNPEGNQYYRLPPIVRLSRNKQRRE